jgi:hypothetical protein
MLHVSSRKCHHQTRTNKKEVNHLELLLQWKRLFYCSFFFHMNNNSRNLIVFFFIYSCLMMTPPTAGSSPGEKIIFAHRRKGGPDKNLYTKSERLALRCRVISASPEKIMLCSRQIIFLPGKGNHKQPTQAPDLVPDCRVSAICTRFHPLVNIVLKGWNM